jgi:glycopeptide antibiotics resistance protein
MMKNIAPDKWKHFFTGIIMGIVLQAFISFLLKDHLSLATIIALIIVIGVSYGFELFSKITGIGRYDFMDAVASTIGGSFGMGVTLVIQLTF